MGTSTPRGGAVVISNFYRRKPHGIASRRLVTGSQQRFRTRYTDRGESFKFHGGQSCKLDSEGDLRAHDEHGDVLTHQLPEGRPLPTAAPDRITHSKCLAVLT
ncbi:jg72 [Pararge aegeria aegeria]|uniref:Jg72 protein n=1 Tax=Pararge aegeria aegeria TaxID=348720 RepID=A0A8S4QA75_9NEOP|nr:jg72 [Pararge aegeria aegeria]